MEKQEGSVIAILKFLIFEQEALCFLLWDL
jgi:hypothetical protein